MLRSVRRFHQLQRFFVQFECLVSLAGIAEVYRQIVQRGYGVWMIGPELQFSKF